MQYKCSTHPLQYSTLSVSAAECQRRSLYSTNTVQIQYKRSTHTVRIQYAYTTHTVHIQHTYSTPHTVRIQYTCSTPGPKVRVRGTHPRCTHARCTHARAVHACTVHARARMLPKANSREPSKGPRKSAPRWVDHERAGAGARTHGARTHGARTHAACAHGARTRGARQHTRWPGGDGR